MIKRLISKLSLIRKNIDFKRQIKKKGGRILRGVKLKIHGKAFVGDDVVIGAHGIDLFDKSQIVLTKDAQLSIGNHVGMTSVSIFCKYRIDIGDYVNIGAGSLIIDSNFHSTDWRIRENRFKDVTECKNGQVTIGHHAFIGARCIIMKGVTIGDRSIIGAGSVVCSSIPNDCIAGGNPCKVITYL